MVTVALDAMGGDKAPWEAVRGGLQASLEFDIKVILVGQEDVIKRELAKHSAQSQDNIEIWHAAEVVEMSESAAVSFRKKKDSSIQVGLRLVKDGKADAFVSAGNTGAVMAASTFILGRCEDVERPAIASWIPTKKGQKLLLDMGSNVDCKPEHLRQFGIMGATLAKAVLGIENPTVGLVNIGEEKDKGNALTLAAYDMLADSHLNFIGNLEGRDIANGKADVMVCDGFVGNAILKMGEGVVELIMGFLKDASKKSLLAKLGLLLLIPTFKRFKKLFDYKEYGGAPLLGLNAVSIVAHGKSDATAVKNAIRAAIKEVDAKIVSKIEGAIHQ